MNSSEAPGRFSPTGEQQAVLLVRAASVALRAGAGCGKTFVLTERYRQELDLPSGRPLGSVVALTFTEKAARELRQRIGAVCRAQLASGADVPRWGLLLRAWKRRRSARFTASARGSCVPVPWRSASIRSSACWMTRWPPRSATRPCVWPCASFWPGATTISSPWAAITAWHRCARPWGFCSPGVPAAISTCGPNAPPRRSCSSGCGSGTSAAGPRCCVRWLPGPGARDASWKASTRPILNWSSASPRCCPCFRAWKRASAPRRCSTRWSSWPG